MKVVNEVWGEENEPDHGEPSMPYKGFGFHLVEKSPVSKNNMFYHVWQQFMKNN